MTDDEFEAIDLSDNDVAKLDNFPLLTHLRTLILNNNSISRIGPALATALPNLTHLVLTNNRLSSITDIHPLHALPRLTHLSLRLCPLTRTDHYRLRVLQVLPRLKALDYARVTASERRESRERFGDFAPQKAQEEPKVNVVETSSGATRKTAADAEAKQRLLQQQMKALIDAIESATSLDEIGRLEQQLLALQQMQRGGDLHA